MSIAPALAAGARLAAEVPGPAPGACLGPADFEDAGAGSWPTWFAGADVRVPPPPAAGSAAHKAELDELRRLQRVRTAEELAQARAFDTRAAGAYWTERMIELVIEHSAKDGARNPPRLSRQLALLETSMHDALVIAWAAKECYQRPAPAAFDAGLRPALAPRDAPAYPSEHAAVAGVVDVLFPVFFPPDEEPEGFEALVREAAESRLVGGANHRSDVEVGLAIGRAAARAALEARAADGSEDTRPVRDPVGPCAWRPTPPTWRPHPVEPRWGNVTPFLMETGAQLRPPPPPACGSVELETQVRDLYEASRALTPRQAAIAARWAGGQGTETPPGTWLWIALNETIEHDASTMLTARVMSHVAASLADGAIAAWDAKYAYWQERPVTAIRASIDPAWSSIITTPPFPGYVSGHATFAGAATTTLAHFFPDAASELSGYATEAALSRYYGGIHIRSDNEAGLVLGASIGALAVEHDRQRAG